MPPKISGPTDYLMDRYNKVDVAAFNALDRVDFKKSIDKAQSFSAGVVDILETAGIDQKYLQGVSGEKVGSEDWLDVFRGAAEGGTDFAVDSMIGAAITAIFPEAEIGGWVAGIFSRVRVWWRGSQAQRELERVSLLKKGTWVWINNGKFPNKEVGWFGSTETGDKEGLRRRLAVFREDHITLGFFIGLGNKSGRITVFNLNKMRDEEVRFDDVSQLNEADTRKFDENEVLTKIRDLKFAKLEKAMVDTDVNLDPGAEAIFEGHLVHILKTERDRVIIEHEDGERVIVSVDKLKPGRRNHTNSWNYGPGFKDYGFQADGSSKVFSGQWVWVDARPQLQDKFSMEMACVWKIDVDGVHVFLALTGEQKVVKKLWPLERELDDYLNEDKSFGRFKSEAVVGGDTERVRLSLDKDAILICLGQTHDVPSKLLETEGRGEEGVQERATEGHTDGPDTTERDERDFAEEIARKTKLRNTYDEDEEFPDPEELVSQSNGLMPYAVMGLGLIFVFNYLNV